MNVVFHIPSARPPRILHFPQRFCRWCGSFGANSWGAPRPPRIARFPQRFSCWCGISPPGHLPQIDARPLPPISPPGPLVPDARAAPFPNFPARTFSPDARAAPSPICLTSCPRCPRGPFPHVPASIFASHLLSFFHPCVMSVLERKRRTRRIFIASGKRLWSSWER